MSTISALVKTELFTKHKAEKLAKEGIHGLCENVLFSYYEAIACQPFGRGQVERMNRPTFNSWLI